MSEKVDVSKTRAPEKSTFSAFSGFLLPQNGRQLLMYTGVSKENILTGEEMIQTQCLAIGDGVDYTKYEAKPVLGKESLPPGRSVQDYRDPKLWRKKDGSYRCILSNRGANGTGQLLYYETYLRVAQNLREESPLLF